MPDKTLTTKKPAAFPICETAQVKKINDFMESPRYLVLVGIITVLANLLGLEIVAYTLFILFAVYTALYGRDFLPIAVLTACCYIVPGARNNPGQAGGSIFYPQNGGIYLLVIFLIFVGCAVYRLIRDPKIGGKAFLTKKRSLMSGMLILGVGYLLAGAFSGRYFANGMANLLFALVQFLAVWFFYWFFSGTVCWERHSADYFIQLGVCVGLTVCGEILVIYTTGGVIEHGAIRPEMVFSGWGNANNIGCMVAMMIPLSVAMGYRVKKSWHSTVISLIMLGCVFLTCSRTSIGAAVLGYVVSVIMFSQKEINKAKLLKFYGILGLVFLCIILLFHSLIGGLFTELLSRGLDPRDRDIIYPVGVETFLKNPIFGEGFYPSTDVIYQWSTQSKMQAILPARWHNTVIQLLASCGLVGLCCYCVHRLQTILLFWKKRNTIVIYIGLSLFSMLLMSMLDCHFFNIGPVLFYSTGLAFAENQTDSP